MNRYEKIDELKREIETKINEPFSGRSPLLIVKDILSIIEDHDACLRVKDNPNKAVEEFPCCGNFETCNTSCSPRADYFKNNSRAELNKLALSILRESLKDEKYRQSWELKLDSSLLESVLKCTNSITKGWDLYHLYGKDMFKIFMDRLFGEIE